MGYLQIHGCIACNKCWSTGVCAFGDIVNEISEKMREADGLLVGSPKIREELTETHYIR